MESVDNKTLLNNGLNALMADGDRPLSGFLAVLTGIVEAGRLLADSATRAAAYDKLLPYADRPDHWPQVIGKHHFTCTRQGRSWRVSLGPKQVTVEHRIGLQYLAVLAANAGHEIDAPELVAGPAVLRIPVLSRQPVLDPAAVRAYQSRLAYLRDDRSDRAAAERGWLTAELAGAAGLAGRTRRFADDEERARVAVTKAIRRAIQHVTDADADIGAHLAGTVHTGSRCVYLPS